MNTRPSTRDKLDNDKGHAYINYTKNQHPREQRYPPRLLHFLRSSAKSMETATNRYNAEAKTNTWQAQVPKFDQTPDPIRGQ